MGGSTGATRRRDGRTGRDQRGAAAVELALVLPILLLLVFGIIAYGYMLSFRGSMSQAAAEGAREAAVNVNAADRETAAMRAVDDALRAYGVSCGDPGMSCDYRLVEATADCATQCAVVDLSYDYDAHPLIPLPFVDAVMPDTISYGASARTS
ncbi:TadE/TadG family type IV pilus assembly protein [Nocardioides sp. CPCC 205120]|uniref:TadE/TadG family type IV pilus assembly protein n=1 Tax=Nocardioides sp. CPCC 205120 TaxID=3406462 RepID=UPI003B4FFD65